MIIHSFSQKYQCKLWWVSSVKWTRVAHMETMSSGRTQLVTTDDDRAVGVMHNVITDATHDGTTHGAKTSRAHHDHWTFLFSRDVSNHLAWLPTEHCFYLPRQLQSIQSLVDSTALTQCTLYTHVVTRDNHVLPQLDRQRQQNVCRFLYHTVRNWLILSGLQQWQAQ